MNHFSVFFFSRNCAYSQVISYLHSLNMPFTMSGIPPFFPSCPSFKWSPPMRLSPIPPVGIASFLCFYLEHNI